MIQLTLSHFQTKTALSNKETFAHPNFKSFASHLRFLMQHQSFDYKVRTKSCDKHFQLQRELVQRTQKCTTEEVMRSKLGEEEGQDRVRRRRGVLGEGEEEEEDSEGQRK